MPLQITDQPDDYRIKPIKYYTFTQTETSIQGTWYEGERGFIAKPSAGRIYPDEYLIIDILEKYLQQLSDPNALEKIVFIKEPWIGNTGQRDGRTNVAIGKKIIDFVDNQPAQNPKPERLVVAPFLFHNHHPGIVVDLINKVAIYLDPFGSSPYRDIIDLQELQNDLKKRGFQFQVVNVEQQQRDKDSSSCGPILTDSLKAFIDKFLAEGCITGINFTPAKTKLATSRLVQMNIRNPKLNQETKAEQEDTVEEISLADVNLWKNFCREQGYTSKKYIDLIIKAIGIQKEYIQKMGLSNNHKGVELGHLAFIIEFQLNLTNVILNKIQNSSIDSFIESWIRKNDEYFHTPLHNSTLSMESFEKLGSREKPTTMKTASVLSDSNENFLASQNTPAVSQGILTPQSGFCSNLFFRVLGGFIFALGITAVVIAFTSLNAATLGAAGLVTLGVGAFFSTILGPGLFFKKELRNCICKDDTIERGFSLSTA